MGVMSCSRKGCDHIMCDDYIDEIGYICYECRDEFTKMVNSNLNIPMSKRDLFLSLQEFINSEKVVKEPNKTYDSVDDFLKDVSRNRYD